jgi:imidazolonepropionase-like amidohydrolase
VKHSFPIAIAPVRPFLFVTRVTALAISAAVVAPVAVAQQPDATTIRAARVLDGRGQLLTNAVVEIRGSKIVAVDQRTTAVTHDLGDVTLMPGMIDVHIHAELHFQPNGKGEQRETPAQRDAAIAENLKATLMAGFTTVQDVGDDVNKVLKERIAVGQLVGPRLLTSLDPVSSGTPLELRERVRRLKKNGADLIKVDGSEGLRAGGGPTMTQEQLDAVCGEATAQGLRTLVHAHAAEAVIRAVKAGCTQVEHGVFASDEALALMRDRGVLFDPTIGLVLETVIENKDRLRGSGNYTEEAFAFTAKAIGVSREMFKRALKSGVKMPLGTDAGAGAHGQNARGIIARVEAGQAPMDGIISATSLAAETMGLGKLIGTLGPGFEADLIAVGDDPTKEIAKLRDVRFVMRAGVVYKR